MYEKTVRAVDELRKAIDDENIDPTKSIPDELFIFSTTLVPIVNVDLFVTNDKGQILLSWRDDIYHGKGWHIPGGCLRLKEKLHDRVIKTAEKEIGVPIKFNPVPITVREYMESDYRPTLSNQLERCHNISFLYDCIIEEGYAVPEMMDGVALRWFDELPDDLLETHVNLYGDIIENYFKKKYIH